MRDPCVSVIVTNFNYGRFLDRCLSSVLEQSYPNLELLICDNNSTDDSLTVINKYIARDPSRVTLVRHRSNLGSAANFVSGERLKRGDYFINLGADDYLHPDYLSTAVKLFNAYPSVSQIVSHTNSVDECGVVTQRTPFFDGSYFIPGPSYAPILMVAGITSHTSQTILNSANHWQAISQPDFITSPTLGERTTAMMHAVAHDVIYLDKPYVVCRDSIHNETFKLNADVSQIIEQLSVINAFASYAQRHGLKAISNRKDEAIAKLAILCTRYAADFMRLGHHDVAGRYLGMSLVLEGTFDGLLGDPDSGKIDGAVARMRSVAKEVRNQSQSLATIRQHSYPPPSDSIRLML